VRHARLTAIWAQIARRSGDCSPRSGIRRYNRDVVDRCLQSDPVQSLLDSARVRANFFDTLGIGPLRRQPPSSFAQTGRIG
jgi:hypothetical protein